LVDAAVPELQRDVVRRDAEAERPAVDVHGRDGRVAGLIDARGRRQPPAPRLGLPSRSGCPCSSSRPRVGARHCARSQQVMARRVAKAWQRGPSGCRVASYPTGRRAAVGRAPPRPGEEAAWPRHAARSCNRPR
jgi:hypothetical protein